MYLTWRNFGDEAELVDVKDLWRETELAARDIVLLRQNMLFGVADLVIDDLTWHRRNFIFAESEQIMKMINPGQNRRIDLILPNNQHIRVHLISHAFLCIRLEMESDSTNTFE